MIKLPHFCATFLIFTALVQAANAADPPKTTEELVSKIQAVYGKSCCFQANFDQLTVNVSMDMRDVFQGRMYVKKPSQISLEVDQPEKQTVVVKGRTYTVYFPEDGNAARGEIPPELNIEHFLGFFANIGSLDKNFNLAFPSKIHDPNEGLIFLELTDLKNPQSSYAILVGIDDQSYVVRRTIIYDALGNYNRFDLKNIRFVESIPEDKFKVLTDISESETLAK